MVLVALALAIPASASAYSSWTANGSAVPAEEVAVGTYSEENWGAEEYASAENFGFDLWWAGNFNCRAAADITVKGTKDGKGLGQVSKLNVDSEFCFGEDAFAGCELESFSNNIPWDIKVEGEKPGRLHVTKTSGSKEIEFKFEFQECNNPLVSTTSQTFSYHYMDMIPTVDAAGKLTSYMLEGTSTNGYIGTYGPFNFDISSEDELGLK